MISTDEALAHVFRLVAPIDSENVDLIAARGRVLASDVVSTRNQPPFRASIMDGYALDSSAVRPGARFRVIGEAAAGGNFSGMVGANEAVRIFTGAPVPDGADRVVIQEDVTAEADRITLNENLDPQAYVRPAGADFEIGHRVPAPLRLGPQEMALLAAMNQPQVTVRRKPIVALISTGDELVMPGEVPSPDQIIASNTFGLAAMIDAAGGQARILPIARDRSLSLQTVLSMAIDADLIVTIGGASVGDYDLVAQVAADMGLERTFYKIAMRPGKPLMAGKLNGVPMVGLPGNPVSSMVCGRIFMLPAIEKMLGLPERPAQRIQLPLTHDIGKNGPREHYMRARASADGLHVFERQDSALLSVLADANCLAVRPPHDPPRKAGTVLDVVSLPPND